MVTMREASSESDWWDVRALLVRTNGQQPQGWNWDIRHWDGNRFHSERTEPPTPVGLWFESGELVGAAHGEGGGDVFLELDVAWRGLEQEMLAWAQSCLADRRPDGGRTLRTLVWDYDRRRGRNLDAAGFSRQQAGWWMRTIDLRTFAHATVELERPYRLATTSEAHSAADAASMAALLNASFGRTIHTASEYIGFMTNSPSFRHDLNLVALAADGTFAAHVGVTFDATNCLGIFEPVCTHPDHRRHGLARSLMLEGLRRLAGLGAQQACVETGDAGPANALYRGLTVAAEYRGHWWQKDWPALNP